MLSFYHFEKLFKRMMYNLCMDIRNYIANYKPYNEQEANDQKQMLKWIDTGLDLFTRENGIAHFTSSAWVCDQSHQHILMAYHNIYQSYSWLGGHNDGDQDFKHVACKEVKEESGVEHVKLLSDDIFSLEILTVDGHIKHGVYVPAHLHLNLTYVFEADRNDPVFVKEDENSAVNWFTKQEAIDKSSEEWFRTHIYNKLNEKLELLDQKK